MERLIREMILPIPEDVDLSGEIKIINHLDNCSGGNDLFKLVSRIREIADLPMGWSGTGSTFLRESLQLRCQGCEIEGSNDLLHPEGPGFWGRPTKEQKDLRDRLGGKRGW